MKNHLKIKNNVFSQKCCFSQKKKPRQGCTKPKTELGMHQNPHFHENQLKINENQKINPPSTITIPESEQTLCNDEAGVGARDGQRDLDDTAMMMQFIVGALDP